MSQVYKVIVPFEFEGRQVKRGEEIVLRSREAEAMVKDNTVAPVDRELDPKDEKDAALLAQCDGRAKARHDGIKAETEQREEKVDERETEKDAVREAKIEEAFALHTQLDPKSDTEARPHFELMADEVLDKEIETMKAGIAATEVKEEVPAEVKPKTKATRAKKA